ncbi:unnamed protein product [Ceutorhynchus assimilis]|uniref:Uncharacterized protein n=1 Tax=Ceutorhynchus assimilis TaxID=467358 RepID=A0A9N9MTY8_9CUCU|nr:unnamed protein product [Ceutorhynchus assimilis]
MHYLILILFIANSITAQEPKEFPEIINGNCSKAKDHDMAHYEVVHKDSIPLISRNTTVTWYGDEKIYCIKVLNEYLKRYGNGGGTAFIKNGGLGHHYITIEMHSDKGGGMEFIIFLYGRKDYN